MGYTHYFYTKRDTDPKLLVEAGQEMARVVRVATPELAGPLGEGAPEIDDLKGIVRFNGRDDDAHESFIWPPNLNEEQPYIDDQTSVFSFCKTAFKPYDPVVVCCLLVAQRVLGEKIEVSSDGDIKEFFGTELSEGWQKVNEMLGSPTEAEEDREGAWDLYKRVFGKDPPIPAYFIDGMVEDLTAEDTSAQREAEVQAIRDRADAYHLEGFGIDTMLEKLEELRGREFDEDTRAALILAFAEPGQESWARISDTVIAGNASFGAIYSSEVGELSEAISSLFGGGVTFWKAVCDVDPAFPRKYPEGGVWPKPPNFETLCKAVEHLYLTLDDPSPGNDFEL